MKTNKRTAKPVQMTDKQIESLVLSMGFETIETRKSDRLDFKDCAIWEVVRVVKAAFEMGCQSAAK